jgi:hypothetical protein
MTYQHAPTVTINGVDYSGNVIDSVTITRGRDTVYSEPQPGFANIQLIDKTGQGLPINVGQDVRIDLDPTRTVFVGTITDRNAALYDPGLRGTPAGIMTITAVGPLMRLNRRIIYRDGRTGELDAERITDIIETALAVPWEEAAGTWAEQTGTWADYLSQPFDPDLIDPGVFDLGPVDPNPDGYTALTLAQQAASSGAGILAETGDGFITFANADRRALNRAASLFQVPADVIRADLVTQSQLADITNRVTVTFADGAVEAEDIDSIQRFGVYASEIVTQLADETNAANRAEDYVEAHSVPTVQMSAVTVRLDGLPEALADDILDLDLNAAVRIPVPGTLRPTSRQGFVEQVVTRFDPFRAEVSLNVSDYRLSEGGTRWGQVDPTLAWEDVSATLEWQDARRVTA